MALPEYEAKVWCQRFAIELRATPAPYYCTHLFDVNQENWDAVVDQVRSQHAALRKIGGRSHLWTVRDHGDRKRVCWIHYYPTSIGEHVTPDRVSKPEYIEGWATFFNLLESYEWFCTSESPSEAPQLGPVKLALFKAVMKLVNVLGLMPKPK